MTASIVSEATVTGREDCLVHLVHWDLLCWQLQELWNGHGDCEGCWGPHFYFCIQWLNVKASYVRSQRHQSAHTRLERPAIGTLIIKRPTVGFCRVARPQVTGSSLRHLLGTHDGGLSLISCKASFRIVGGFKHYFFFLCVQLHVWAGSIHTNTSAGASYRYKHGNQGICWAYICKTVRARAGNVLLTGCMSQLWLPMAVRLNSAMCGGWWLGLLWCIHGNCPESLGHSSQGGSN